MPSRGGFSANATKPRTKHVGPIKPNMRQNKNTILATIIRVFINLHITRNNDGLFEFLSISWFHRYSNLKKKNFFFQCYLLYSTNSFISLSIDFNIIIYYNRNWYQTNINWWEYFKYLSQWVILTLNLSPKKTKLMINYKFY